jgi:hypothetical protein
MTYTDALFLSLPDPAAAPPLEYPTLFSIVGATYVIAVLNGNRGEDLAGTDRYRLSQFYYRRGRSLRGDLGDRCSLSTGGCCCCRCGMRLGGLRGLSERRYRSIIISGPSRESRWRILRCSG